VTAEKFRPVADELFDRIMQMADNAGATNEHRALSYLAMRYPAIYAIAAECHARDCSLTAAQREWLWEWAVCVPIAGPGGTPGE
jgi:hypothetical protein